MTILQIVTLFAAISNIFLGFLVLKRNIRSRINLAFAAFAFVTGLWVMTNFLQLCFPTLFLVRLPYAGGALLAAASLGWVLVFCLSKIRLFFVSYILGLFFLA